MENREKDKNTGKRCLHITYTMQTTPSNIESAQNSRVNFLKSIEKIAKRYKQVFH